MAKVNASFRLEEYSIGRLQKLAEYYTENVQLDLAPGRKSKVSKTDVLDFLINKAFQEMEKEEEDKWVEKNINKLNS